MELRHFPALTDLNLGCNGDVTDAGLKELRRLPTLASLDLYHCSNIADAGLKELSRVTSLITNLDLMEYCEKVTDEGLHEGAQAHVQAQLPRHDRLQGHH